MTPNCRSCRTKRAWNLRSLPICFIFPITNRIGSDIRWDQTWRRIEAKRQYLHVDEILIKYYCQTSPLVIDIVVGGRCPVAGHDHRSRTRCPTFCSVIHGPRPAARLCSCFSANGMHMPQPASARRPPQACQTLSHVNWVY